MARAARTRKDKVTEASVPGYDEIAYGLPASRGDGVRTIHPMNESQREALDHLRHKTLTILTGPPGTAKTLLSVFIACEKLQRRQIDKIYYIKPIVDTPGEKGIGYLPGTEADKLAPHVESLRDSLSVFMVKGKGDYLIDKKIIEFLPIEHLRGALLAPLHDHRGRDAECHQSLRVDDPIPSWRPQFNSFCVTSINCLPILLSPVCR
jgi:phosphate starvation-inducible protein PhoH